MTGPAPDSGTRSNDRPKRLIAIVDADGVHLYYTGMLLQRLDYDIHAMRTAGEVFDLLDMARPALILTELGLPDMEGLEFIRKIKRNPRTYSIPVIVYTSRRDAAARDACMKEGCKDFLQKPAEPEVLYAAIQKVTEATPRQFIRLATSLNVMLGSGKDADLSATQDIITALSEQGMFVGTPKPLAAGAQVSSRSSWSVRASRWTGRCCTVSSRERARCGPRGWASSSSESSRLTRSASGRSSGVRSPRTCPSNDRRSPCGDRTGDVAARPDQKDEENVPCPM